MDGRGEKSSVGFDYDGMSRLVSAVHAKDEMHDAGPDPSPGLPAVDGYRLERFVGSGSGGDVYSAFRDGSDRRVAVKMLKGRPGDDRQMKRARRELQILEDLRVAAAPRLLDHGMHEDRRFLVTEFVEGLPLVEHCERADHSMRERVELLALVADAVQSIHEQGVIHRDLKPSNILVTKRGRPMIVDLGVATLSEPSSLETLTEEGARVGSPAFMPPEQARGERAKISTRSDVYGLGATAYFALLGAAPHGDDSARARNFRTSAFEEAIRPREVDRAFPKDLSAVLMKALSLAPENRYASASEFAADLRRWLAGDAVEAQAPRFWTRLTRLMQRRPVMTAIAIGLLMGTSIGSGFLAYSAWLNTMAVGLDITNERRTVIVRSRNGRELHRWGDPNSNPPVQYKFADLFQGVGDSRADDLVVIALPRETQTEHAGSVAAFRPPDFENPVWTSTCAFPPERAVPTFGREVTGEFTVNRGIRADVFPEIGGDEIVVCFAHHPWSAACIRVLAPTGELLYERWHDGHVMSVMWHAPSNQLLVTAHYSRFTWASLGLAGKSLTSAPVVAFALRPELGSAGDILRPMERSHSLPWESSAVWYRMLLPAEILGRYDLNRAVVRPASNPVSPDAVAGLNVYSSDGGNGVHFLLRPDGRTTYWFAADSYKEYLDADDDLRRLEWSVVPPPLPGKTSGN